MCKDGTQLLGGNIASSSMGRVIGLACSAIQERIGNYGMGA